MRKKIHFFFTILVSIYMGLLFRWNLRLILFRNRPPESVFVQFDQDGNGRIDKDEFVKGLKTLGLHLSDKDTDLLWDFLDDDGGGDLDVHEMCSKLKIMHDKAIMNERVEKYVVKLLHLVIPALIRDPRTGDLR